MKKFVIAAALTLMSTGSAMASDSFSFGISLGVPAAPASVRWDSGYPVVREYRPVIVRGHDHRRRHDRDCRTVREEYYDRGRMVSARTSTICDTRHDDWRLRDNDRGGWRRDDRRYDRY